MRRGTLRAAKYKFHMCIALLSNIGVEHTEHMHVDVGPWWMVNFMI